MALGVRRQLVYLSGRLGGYVLLSGQNGKPLEILLVKTPVSCQESVRLQTRMGADQKIGKDTVSFPPRFTVFLPDSASLESNFWINDHRSNAKFSQNLI